MGYMSLSRTLERVKRGLETPHLALRELNKYYYRMRGPDEDAVDMLEADWDNLIILDACRYDTFAERADLPGELESRTTRSSSTIDFMHRYVDGADLRDTVYVTANPQLHRQGQKGVDADIHEVVDLTQADYWDDEFRTVRPETVADATLEAHREHPDKRLMVHYIQPHYPFIGETGREHFDLDSLDFWNRVVSGEIDVSDEVLLEAYEENLDLALPSVERLLEELDGKSVVTADHGQMFGERASPIPMRDYGHPTELFTPELVTVPWHVHRSGDRR